MISKSITYIDYNGNERTETHWFNMNDAEIMDMELSITGGMSKMIEQIIEAQDTPALMKVFKDLILKSYGVKSPDGKRFIKSDEITLEFTQTEAYVKLYTTLANNTKEAIEFINGVIPNKKDSNNNVTTMPVAASNN